MKHTGINFDEPVKNPKIVIPAQAGIYNYLKNLDSRLRGNDRKSKKLAFYEAIEFKYLLLSLIMYLTMLFIAPDISLSFELEGWYHREIGYQTALKESISKEAPLILFFYLDSNDLSQRLKDEYLRSYELYRFLSTIPKADINLDGDIFEKAIAEQYKVEKEEPALLVVFPFYETEPRMLSPFLEDSDMTPEDFANNLRNIFVLEYNNIGYDCFEKEEYKKAVEYYNSSIKYDPNRAYTYFALGSAYHAMAIEEKSMEIFSKSEESYIRALELDPDFKESSEELKKLHENIEKLRLK